MSIPAMSVRECRQGAIDHTGSLHLCLDQRECGKNRRYRNGLRHRVTAFSSQGTRYDSILVVVDRYSKMVQYIPCNKDMDAEELAEIMENRVFQHFGMSKSCVSDRESLFTSA